MSMKQLSEKTYFAKAGFIILATMFLFVNTVSGASTKTSYKFPSIIFWAVGDVGSKAYAIPAVVSEKISSILGSKIRLIPGNDMERINMLRSGRAHLSYTSADAYWGTMGLTYYSNLAVGPQPLRTVWAAWPHIAGSTGLASAASGIKTPYDLKGKRLVRIVGAGWSSEGIRASLAFANLSLDDVKILEVSSTGASYKALAEGKGDFTMGAINAPGAYEAEASPYGIYIVRYPQEDKAGWERYRRIMPYHVPGYSTAGAGIKQGEKVSTPLYPNPMFCTLDSQPDEFAYAFCKAMYKKIDEISTAYPGAEALLPDRAIIPEATIMAPFHNGAVKFFKEIGMWKEAHETANKKRLAHLEKLNKRWLVYLEDAHERMLKTEKKVNPEKEWWAIVEKEIGLLP